MCGSGWRELRTPAPAIPEASFSRKPYNGYRSQIHIQRPWLKFLVLLNTGSACKFENLQSHDFRKFRGKLGHSAEQRIQRHNLMESGIPVT
jgi:hypothetical protein